MKKILCMLLICSLMISVMPVHASSISNENGFVSITTKVLQKERGNVVGEKEYVFRNSENEILWKITLTGIFSYTGYSATCTSASAVSTVYSGNWSESANNTYPSGNQAVANVTMVRKFLFIVMQTEIANLVITCDKDGNIT